MNYLDDPDNVKVRWGDTCVVYLTDSLRFMFKIDEGNALNTKFGSIRAHELVGHPYGVRYNCRKGWVLPLRLTPEFWTQLLPHRTQILYQPDISMILMQLDVKPGTIVIESGTGSGSLSHCLLRACIPRGHLYTFEFNQERAIHADREFREHGFGDNVTVTHRDVCQDGFLDDLKEKADACILDLPKTWMAIEHANACLKRDGSRLCSFSPCIEQVQRTVAKLTELKFQDIVTMECLTKSFDIKPTHVKTWPSGEHKKYVAAKPPSTYVGHSGYLTFATKW